MVSNNTVGNNNLLLSLVIFETSLITGEEARCFDDFNRTVVELDK